MKTAPLFLLNFRLFLVLAFTAMAPGCSTLQYRAVQTRFEEAVRADNDQLSMPFMDSADRYRAIAGELSPEYIARLDARLRPNAWTLRGVSQWRAGEFAPAVASATEGLDEIARQQPTSPQLEHSRDRIILTMLPGLVEDGRLRQRFNENGAADVAAHYDEYAARFHTALRALAEARENVGPATPPEVIAYWDYQCWRVLQNWLFIISQLPLDDQAVANQAADEFVQTTLANAGLPAATTLPKAIEALEQSIQPPYRQLIELERQR
jgi:hypothetical protein